MLRLPSLGELDQGLRVRVYLCTSPTDMRKGFDTLAALVRDALGCDPLSGQLFLFISRRRDRLKILTWDRDGYALWYKRLEQGTFETVPASDGEPRVRIDSTQLAMILGGVTLESTKRRKRYRLSS